MKPSVKLYNNIATSGDCIGRLSSEMEVFPSPRVHWDFETLGDQACQPDVNNWQLKDPLIGRGFQIDQPYVTNQGQGNLSGQQQFRLTGVASQANFGRQDLSTSSFGFFLPNTRLLEVNFDGQKFLANVITTNERDKEPIELGRQSGGRYLESSLNEDWQLHLETRINAIEWLQPSNRNVGTFITTKGNLFSRGKKGQIDDNSSRVKMTLSAAIETLSYLSLLLSFANGGYLGPLYVEAYNRDNQATKNGPLETAGSVLTYAITPLEQLGKTWLTAESDLPSFLQCYTDFKRMVSLPHWKNNFHLILDWYFQAIQPLNIQTGKPWPVIANALGAALELLETIIIMREVGIGIRKLKSAERLRKLIQHIGLPLKNGFNGVDFVQNFIDVRNNATHPQCREKYSKEKIYRILQIATQWVEEALLWRIGYNGQYRNRFVRHYNSTDPCYDLSARDLNW
jgi:hypothetical protein